MVIFERVGGDLLGLSFPPTHSWHKLIKNYWLVYAVNQIALTNGLYCQGEELISWVEFQQFYSFDWATSDVAKPCVVDVHDGSSTQVGSTMMMSTKYANPIL
jgi:hypothetical protein